MKDISTYIIENIDDENNTFWLLDVWFERNEADFMDFMNLIALFNNRRTIEVNELSKGLENTNLSTHLYEFVNFIDNDLDADSDKDYIYSLKKILEYVINNQSKKSKKYKR